MRAASLASSLQFRLLDYHGGVADLNARLLRPPVPQDVPTATMRAEILRSEEEAAQACSRPKVSPLNDTGPPASAWLTGTVTSNPPDPPLLCIASLRPSRRTNPLYTLFLTRRIPAIFPSQKPVESAIGIAF